MCVPSTFYFWRALGIGVEVRNNGTGRVLVGESHFSWCTSGCGTLCGRNCVKTIHFTSRGIAVSLLASRRVMQRAESNKLLARILSETFDPSLSIIMKQAESRSGATHPVRLWSCELTDSITRTRCRCDTNGLT